MAGLGIRASMGCCSCSFEPACHIGLRSWVQLFDTTARRDVTGMDEEVRWPSSSRSTASACGPSATACSARSARPTTPCRSRGCGCSAPTPDEIDNLAAWLTTVVARICLNVLRSRRNHPDEPLEVHVPDPVIDRPDAVQPEHEALLADAVGHGADDRAADPAAGRTPGARAARLLRRPVRGDRHDPRQDAGRHPPAGQPRPPQGAGLADDAGARPGPPAGGRRRLLRRRPGRRLRRPGRACSIPTSCCTATPAAPTRRGSCAARRPSPATRSCSRARWRDAAPGAGQRRRRRRSSQQDGQVIGLLAFIVADGRIVAIDALNDLDRLARLDLSVLD